MSQGAPDDLAIYLGLQGFEVESIEFLTGDDSPSGDPMKLVHVRTDRVGMCVRSAASPSPTAFSMNTSGADFVTVRSATSRPTSSCVFAASLAVGERESSGFPSLCRAFA